MTGYVMISREKFKLWLDDPIKIHDIVVYIINGGQQTRAMQKAMEKDRKVHLFREIAKNYPVVTIYCGLEMEEVDFPTVIY
jgi:hypothetical protein